MKTDDHDALSFADDAGSIPVRADPLAVRRRLHAAVGGGLRTLVRESRDRNVHPMARSAAAEQLAAAARDAFGLEAFDPATGGGALESECLGVLRRFFAWEAEVLAETRFEADLVAAYGHGVLAMPYRKRYGLWLHLGRVRTQRASEVQAGVSAAHSTDELPREWFDGVCGLAETAEDAMAEGNMHRAMRRLEFNRGRS